MKQLFRTVMDKRNASCHNLRTCMKWHDNNMYDFYAKNAICKFWE